MNKFAFFILFLSVYSFAKSQTYDLIFPKQTNFYTDSVGNIYPIKINSISLVGNDSILIPYTMLDRDNIFKSDTICQNPNDTNWIGPKIIKGQAGEYVFFNRRNDSIKIQSRAPLNSTFKLFQYKNGDYINGTISSVQTEAVLGIIDSTKEISLQFFSNGQPISSQLNNLKLKISKTYGLINFPEIYYFPYTCNPLKFIGNDSTASATFIKDKDIYDFNIGDQLFYRGNGSGISSYSYTLIKRYIIDRKDYNDSVQYKEVVFTASLGSDIPYLDTSIVTTTIRFDKDTFNVLPFKQFSWYGQPYEITYCQDTSYHGRESKKYRLVGSGNYSDSCYYYNTGNGSYASSESVMARGLGRVEYHSYRGSGMSFYDNQTRLAYYKKGNEVWGNDFDLCSYIGRKVSIYTCHNFNFCSNEVTVSGVSSLHKIEWYLNGKRLNVSDNSIKLYNPSQGWYKVIVRYGNCVSPMSDSVFVASGISSINPFPVENFFEIFPSPFGAEFTIKVSLPSRAIIKNSLGIEINTQLLNEGTNVINTSALPSGVYFIEMISENRRLVQKIIKD
jgi:hypothetical protein